MGVIRKLQLRFIVITMGSFFLVLCAVLTAVNMLNYRNVKANLDEKLVILAENGGVMPGGSFGNWNREGMGGYNWTASEEPPAGSREMLELRYFIISSGQSPAAQEYNLRFISSVTSSDARAYFDRVMDKGLQFGTCDDFRYYIDRGEDGSYTAVFLYCHDEFRAMHSLLLTTVLIGFVSLLVVLLLTVLLSRRAIRPIVQSIERQKQFITDASHELKTPIGILSANNDVLAMEYGESEWTVSSRGQIRRLSGLISDLVTLTRLDERRMVYDSQSFCVSDTARVIAESFRPEAEQKGQTLTLDIAPDLSLRTDESAFRQLMEILLENAVKYTPEGGKIELNLRGRGRGAVVTLRNTVEKLPDAKPLDKLFDRFYRDDSSRSEQPGYGIGLSIAKTLADTMSWKLNVHADGEHAICFTAEI